MAKSQSYQDDRSDLDFAFEVKAIDPDDGKRQFTGYASVFGEIDQGRDIVLRGAFSQTIADWKGRNKWPSMFWSHDAKEPIGKWLEMKEDDYGLLVRGVLTPGVQRADEVYASLKFGAVDGLSIGYRVTPNGADWDDDLSVRKIKAVDLIETSLVSNPMLRSATISDVKSGRIPTERDIEGVLMRDAGLSSKKAKALIAGGYKAMTTERDAGVGVDDGAREALADLARLLRA